MKPKEKALKITMTFPPQMDKHIAKLAKFRKVTLEQTVGDLIYLGMMSNFCCDTGIEILGKIFRKKAG